MVADETWKIWIDTGGTFTDCVAINPDGDMQRIKVLSSGALRGRVISRTGDRQYLIATNWPLVANIFFGYTFRSLSIEADQTSVKSYDSKRSLLELEDELDISPGSDFEITAHEEAPILCARLATETSLSRPLPPLNMRLGSTIGINALLERKEELPFL